MDESHVWQNGTLKPRWAPKASNSAFVDDLERHTHLGYLRAPARPERL
jgi:hypothetical protein